MDSGVKAGACMSFSEIRDDVFVSESDDPKTDSRTSRINIYTNLKYTKQTFAWNSVFCQVFYSMKSKLVNTAIKL